MIDPLLFEAHYDTQIAATPMPDEYKYHWMSVICNDCQHTSKVKFHVMGGKCESCRSYNTT